MKEIKKKVNSLKIRLFLLTSKELLFKIVHFHVRVHFLGVFSQEPRCNEAHLTSRTLKRLLFVAHMRQIVSFPIPLKFRCFFVAYFAHNDQLHIGVIEAFDVFQSACMTTAGSWSAYTSTSTHRFLAMQLKSKYLIGLLTCIN